MSNNKQQTHGPQGFTLVEIMIALLIFMVIMLGLAAGLLQTLRVNKANVVRDEALRLATDDLNQLKGQQFSLSGTSTALAAAAWTAPTNVLVNIRAGSMTFARSRQVIDLATSATALKRIDVAIGWNDPAGGGALAPTNRNRQMTLSTIIVRSDQ